MAFIEEIREVSQKQIEDIICNDLTPLSS